MSEDAVDRQSGVGTPRSADTTTTGGGASGDPIDPAITTGAGSSAHPTEQGAGGANRSGSGGSGGPGAGSEDQEGSTGESMDELLAGDASEKPM